MLLDNFRFDPVYPERARVARANGRVVLQAMIDKEGRVDNAQVLGCSQTGLGFEDSALEAVMQWRYDPATRNGETIEVFFTVVVDYHLH